MTHLQSEITIAGTVALNDQLLLVVNYQTYFTEAHAGLLCDKVLHGLGRIILIN